MIDNFSIFVSTVLILYVLMRAVRLNRTLPWFGGEEPSLKDRNKAKKNTYGPRRL